MFKLVDVLFACFFLLVLIAAIHMGYILARIRRASADKNAVDSIIAGLFLRGRKDGLKFDLMEVSKQKDLVEKLFQARKDYQLYAIILFVFIIISLFIDK